MKYDYLIVGSGLFGSIFAYEASQRGKTCLVIDKRNHVGGNIYTKEIEGINVHKYGAHIFHTSNKEVWEYIQQFATFNRYTNSPIANYKGEIYNMPFNMNTFNKLWGVVTPEEAKAKIQAQIKESGITEPKNLEEQAISLVGKDIYEKLVKDYTEKQWGRPCRELPAFIIKRLPVRFTYDNVDVRLNCDFFEHRKELEAMADKVVFTGMIDQYYNYCYGTLEYRSLRFEEETLDMNNYQGNAVVNYNSANEPYTRIIEHKHFEYGTQEKTVITREYPVSWQKGDEPYYPMNDEKNNELYAKYKELADKEDKVIFGGRLGMYKYFDMHHVIDEALKCVKAEL